MKKSFIFALKLLAICAIATFVLALTNQATAPVIEAAQKQKEIDAFAEVFPDLEEVRPLEDQSVLNDNILAVNEAVVGGETVGYLYTVASPNGYDGPVSFVVGAKLDGEVTGLKVIAQTETKGFGAAVAEPKYAEGMHGVTLTQPLKAEGAGGGPDVIPAISGATRTTTAMEKAMNMVVETHAALTGASVDTRPQIQEASPENLEAAFPGAKDFEPVEGAPTNDVVRVVYKASEGGKDMGYVFHAMEPDGFLGPIELLVGIKADGTIAGLSVVSMSESPEYGAAITTPEYAQSLVGKKPAEAPVAISGATFTSEAMTHAMTAIVDALAALGK